MVTNTTDHAGARSGTDTMNALKSGVAGIHGVGETIRGNFNQAVDTAFNDRAGQAKNQQVANNGLNEINDGQYRGHYTAGAGRTNTGVAGPATTTTSTGTTGMTGGSGISGSSNHGPHGSNLMNKLDPKVDSDMDHRGTTATTGQPITSTTTATSTGPHSSSLGNKLDPTLHSGGPRY